MGKINALHLSDLHIGNLYYDDPEELAIAIINDIEHQRTNYRKLEAIFVTGDIFDKKYGSNEKEIQEAVNFFNKIHTEIREREININFSKEDFIFVPGNHDLIRTDQGADFKKYDNFLKCFYGDNYNDSGSTVKYNEEYWSSLKIFHEKKILVIGLNSCKGEKKDDEWDDYGYISLKQLSQSFKDAKKLVENLDDYTVVSIFHHHFYPFPEIQTKHGDTSLIRNYDEVIDMLIKNNVKIVLHGHKHTQIVRPVVNDSYFYDSKSLIVVCSAGSIGNKSVENRAFQIAHIFEPDDETIVSLDRFEYKGLRCDNVRKFSYPPQKEYGKIIIDLLKIIQVHEEYLYIDYLDEIKAKDVISPESEKIIEFINKIYSEFKSTREELQRNPKIIYLILIAIHYRCVFLDKNRSTKTELGLHDELLNLFNNKILKLEDEFYGTGESNYFEKMIEILASKTNDEFIDKCVNIDKMFKQRELKKVQSFIIATIFLTDLYLTLRKYGEFYFKKEKIDHRTNVVLEENKFRLNIVPNTIELSPDEDRRALKVEFKCTDPTVHKVAVLIMKDFEMRIPKIEDNFNNIGLKLYYILPKVFKDKYELDNYNFEAYIPKLMPLLIGENIYKEHNVFIRELIQNSKDAISLRKKLNPEDKFDETIIIKFGSENINGNIKKFMEILDNGTGMDECRIQRYFTSIGRSFYNSDEYNDMLSEKKASYNAISSFGIGFLSSFLVSKEIKVLTNSCFEKNNGLEIEIPNYDGCFFIRKPSEKASIGTRIRLYEDERKRINYAEIYQYVKKTILNIDIPIKIINENIDEVEIESHNLYKYLFKKNTLETPMFFVPFCENKDYDYPYDDVKEEIQENPYGILIDFFSHRKKTVIMNEGLLLKEEHRTIFSNLFSNTYVNYPPNLIKLDVSREKIVEKNELPKTEEEIKDDIIRNILQWMEKLEKEDNLTKLRDIDKVYCFTQNNNLEQDNEKIRLNLYGLEISMYDEKIYFKITKQEKINNNSILLRGSLIDFINECRDNKEVFFQLINKITEKKDSTALSLEFNRDKIIPTYRGRKRYKKNYSLEFERYIESAFEKKAHIDIKKRFERSFGKEFEELFEKDFEYDFGSSFEKIIDKYLEEKGYEEITDISGIDISRKRFKRVLTVFYYNLLDITEERIRIFDFIYNLYILKNIMFHKLSINDLKDCEYETIISFEL
ncbi:metallophosphoesterase [Clostridium sp. C2-6-12]|uniref:metallophosphoesterase n=1 Tax=Clostridium sp. C2-6-12 TaxID=2698832 RepID=UPI0013682F78|nr:metallophosphoesterase [Clostridium sp. C2-6-12]